MVFTTPMRKRNQSHPLARLAGVEARAGHGRLSKTGLLRLHNAFIKPLHLFGRSKSVRFYLKRFRSHVTRSNLQGPISRDLAYISLHLLDANRATHEHWVFATLSRHSVSHLSSEIKTITPLGKSTAIANPRQLGTLRMLTHPQHAIPNHIQHKKERGQESRDEQGK